ncbi:hypothetical protein CR152_24445 [Massilia violaceinigra]|uniref:Uncharacterized protein n=1 Tax=Massilia violaceinigra TaxID=2045208 RepID=A0A2D2DQR2_9BURK|nr:hypothetical protein [Massilia violaceinigra]ATQ77314.1 hypothetical protein CR152_24445 [Massilia violaceinigra]
MKTDDSGRKQASRQPEAKSPPPPIVPEERARFRALVMTNPNYFGNIQASPFPPVLNIKLNTTYERLACVGFQPQFNRLDAVVYIFQPNGYGGGICSSGSQEYVRFYLSSDDGASWQDAGLTSFFAFDIPEGSTGRRRLEYAVTLRIDPAKRFCFLDNTWLVRAILAWNVPPPPDTPNFVPVWGNIHNTHIRVDPLRTILIEDLLQHAGLSLPPVLAEMIDAKQEVKISPPKVLGTRELQALYKGRDVEPHRYALGELHDLVSQPELTDVLMAPGFTGVLTELDVDIADTLFPAQSSTRYEQLECIGLNYEQDTLVGVLRIKLPNGYSGGPCTAGSKEFVTFWGDFKDDGTFATCLGTTSVTVHDIGRMPREGLEYSVFLPVDLDRYRRTCQEGPVLVPIRATLSWQVGAPCDNPDYIPVWGNRLDTLVHVRAGRGPAPTGRQPIIDTIGSMALTDIDGAGYASGPAQLAGFTAVQSPFGGEVVITGHIANPTDISSGAGPLKYRVIVNGGNGDQLLANTFPLARSQLLDGVWSFLPTIPQAVDAAGFYTYQEDRTGAPGNAEIFVLGNVLARWDTAGKTGAWQVRMEVKDAANVVYAGNPSIVRLDNAGPRIPAGSFKITTETSSCADFVIGDVIEGTYQVSGQHFSSLSVSVQPALGGNFTAPLPLPRTYPAVPTTGEGGVWRLDTSGMPRCGYVIRLGASDRTIVDSGYVGWGAEAFVGLCLKLATA